MAEFKSLIDIASELRGKSVKTIYDALDYYFVSKNKTEYTDLATTIMDIVAEGGSGAAKDIATRFASPTNKYTMSEKQRWSVAYAFQKIDDSVVDVVRRRYMQGSSIASATQSSLLSKYAKKIDDIFASAAKEATAIAGTIRKINPNKLFSFKDYPQTHDRIAKLEKWMSQELEGTISNNISEEWALAEAQGQVVTSDFLHKVYEAMDGEAAPSIKARYYRNNTEAHDAFLARTINGMGLSDRVWKLTEQCKQELEMAIDIGLGDGLSAQEMSRSIRQYLKEPDKLFRRVRDKHGNLVLSKAAKAYHPGQGVYRSSYKNALRLSATEGNIAYRTADHLKWQQLDFVVGIKIGLSNNHTLNGVPFHDICDELAGRYPKDFKFTGWHPFCRCIASTILMTPEEFKANEEAFLYGKEPAVRSKNEVDDVPPQFKKWRKENADKIKSAKSLPYFVRDNEQYFNPTKITKIAAKGVKESQALNKALAQTTDPAVLREQAFVPAKTIKEVETRLHKSGIASVELGNITLAEANIALEAIEVEARGHKLDLAKFRVADDVYEGVRSRATNNIGGIFNVEKRTLSLNTSIFRESIYRKPLSWDERIDALEGKISTNKAEIQKYEAYLGKNKRMDKELKAHISQLKQQNLGFEKQIYEFSKLRDADTPSYTHLVAEQFESIREQAQAQIHHEFGHYVDARLGRPSSKGIKASISEYGSKMDNESFAEWYAHYRMKGAEGVPADLLKIFEEYDLPEVLDMSQIREAVESGLTTENHSLLFANGAFTAKRKSLQKRIVDDYIKGYSTTSDTVYMLGGATANGKSTLVASGRLPHPKGALVIDSDKVKGMIPEYKAMLQSGNKGLIKKAANFVHEESSMISKEIQERALSNSLASVFDGINNDSADKIAKKVATLRKQSSGKRIRADYVSLDTEMSLKLAEARAQKTGREVPRDVILKSNRGVSAMMPEVLERKIFDELYLWDTNINGTPRLILKQIDGVITIENQELYERFLAKATQ